MVIFKLHNSEKKWVFFFLPLLPYLHTYRRSLTRLTYWRMCIVLFSHAWILFAVLLVSMSPPLHSSVFLYTCCTNQRGTRTEQFPCSCTSESRWATRVRHLGSADWGSPPPRHAHTHTHTQGCSFGKCHWLVDSCGFKQVREEPNSRKLLQLFMSAGHMAAIMSHESKELKWK